MVHLGIPAVFTIPISAAIAVPLTVPAIEVVEVAIVGEVKPAAVQTDIVVGEGKPGAFHTSTAAVYGAAQLAPDIDGVPLFLEIQKIAFVYHIAVEPKLPAAIRIDLQVIASVG